MGQSTPEEVVEDWMNSDGHRHNILQTSPNGRTMAIGVGVYYESGKYYWVQLFGALNGTGPDGTYN